ncbi:MAG: TIGR04255 family protein [Candidatus Binatia bacterium]
MPQPRYLRNAPITEAIIDFRVKASSDINSNKFAALKPRLAAQFPSMEEQRQLSATIELDRNQGEISTRQRHGIQGYRFKTTDGRTIAQFRVDGFTFNRLPPYTRWEELFPQAMELWRVYCDTARPVTVTRLALRYINRINLTSKADFDSYLRAGPVVPPEVPQTLTGFLTRVTITNSQSNVLAHVAQALEAGTQRPGIILDIDAFKGGQFASNDPIIETIFGQLREFKNLIFFNYLTEETLRGFE